MAEEEKGIKPYTCFDAKEEAGTSIDWLDGLRASIKKWEQIVEGNTEAYHAGQVCGICLVAYNIAGGYKESCQECYQVFPVLRHLCAGGGSISEAEPEEVLAYLKERLEQLENEERRI